MKLRYCIYAVVLALGLAPAASVAQTRVINAKTSAKPTDSRKPSTAKLAPEQNVIVRDEQFHSESLARDMKYRIILPADYDSGVRRYPVLYLLHGLMGSYIDWESRTNLTEYVKGMKLIVVMPDGNDAWYTNSEGDLQDRFEDYIVKDLIAEIDSKYRTIATRHARAIAGLSMGGYGAMKFALKYPQLFVFGGSFSGALNAAGNFEMHGLAQKYSDGMMRIFGPQGSRTRAENDLFLLVAKADPSRLPYLYLGCGTSDPLLKSNRDFVDALTARKITYEYHETPGAHSWGYWDHQVQEMLRILPQHMNVQ